MIKLNILIKLRKQIRILEHANTDLKSELALQKEYNLRIIDELRHENTELRHENIELEKELKDKRHCILFAVSKRQTYLADKLMPIIETREPVITSKDKVSVFDELMANGFIRKNREDDNFVIYELGLKKE